MLSWLLSWFQKPKPKPPPPRPLIPNPQRDPMLNFDKWCDKGSYYVVDESHPYYQRGHQ